jgi:hypothetical protein
MPSLDPVLCAFLEAVRLYRMYTTTLTMEPASAYMILSQAAAFLLPRVASKDTVLTIHGNGRDRVAHVRKGNFVTVDVVGMRTCLTFSEFF